MARVPNDLVVELSSTVRRLDRTRQKVDALKTAGQLTDTDVAQVYEAVFIGAYTAFEGFLEDLFVGLIVSGKGLRSRRKDIAPRIGVQSHSIAREVIYGPGRQYSDWLPYEYTEKRARVFLKGGRPFSELSTDDKLQLRRAHVIRNAIAHRSRHSLAQFEKFVIGGLTVTGRERRPDGFLRGFAIASPPTTRLEKEVFLLLGIARKLGT